MESLYTMCVYTRQDEKEDIILENLHKLFALLYNEIVETISN